MPERDPKRAGTAYKRFLKPMNNKMVNLYEACAGVPGPRVIGASPASLAGHCGGEDEEGGGQEEPRRESFSLGRGSRCGVRRMGMSMRW
jgi:hypothetical protein